MRERGGSRHDSETAAGWRAESDAALGAVGEQAEHGAAQQQANDQGRGDQRHFGDDRKRRAARGPTRLGMQAMAGVIETVSFRFER